MQALLEQNFDVLLRSAEERINKCVHPIKTMTTLKFFIIWQSINDILFDTFHGSRYMWIIEGNETDDELVVKFQDQLCNITTKSIVVQIKQKINILSSEEFRKLSYPEMEEYINLMKNVYGYTKSELSSRMGKSVAYIGQLMSSYRELHDNHKERNEKGKIINFILMKCMRYEIPYLTRFLSEKIKIDSKLIGPRIYRIKNHKASCNGISNKAEAEADRLFIEMLNVESVLIDSMIRNIKSDKFTQHDKIGFSNQLNICGKSKYHKGKFVQIYEGESILKLQKLKEKIITLTKGGLK